MDLSPLAARMAAPSPGTAAKPAPDADAASDAPARAAAEAFEASFLTEMLKESGVNQASSAFDGGAGEEAFSSFLTEQYARKLSERGGLGIAEKIFEALKARGAGA